MFFKNLKPMNRTDGQNLVNLTINPFYSKQLTDQIKFITSDRTKMPYFCFRLLYPVMWKNLFMSFYGLKIVERHSATVRSHLSVGVKTEMDKDLCPPPPPLPPPTPHQHILLALSNQSKQLFFFLPFSEKAERPIHSRPYVTRSASVWGGVRTPRPLGAAAPGVVLVFVGESRRLLRMTLICTSRNVVL